MNKKWIIIMILFPLQLFSQVAEDRFEFHYKDVPFSEFADSIFGRTGVRIYSDGKQTGKVRISIRADSMTVFDAVVQSLIGTGLKVSGWNNDIIVSGIKLISGLPAYDQNIVADSVTVTEKPLDESKFLKTRGPQSLRTVTIGQVDANSARGIKKIIGRVLDQETGEPLVSVPVYIEETRSGVLSDEAGSFILTLPRGRYNARIGFLGYEEEKFILEVFSEGSFVINLKRAAIRLQDVIVTGESGSAIRIREPGFDRISARNIRSMPVLMGERDILKATGTLPGIISNGEGNAGLSVRGSNSDQNAFFLNRIPVFNTSHLFGFFSSFNSDIIKDFSIYKGYVPAEFGGRLASVFNITARQGNRKNFTARGGISPVAANIVAEGPLKKDTASFIISIRTSYSDWILSKIRDTTINASKARFNDISGGLNRDFGRTRASIFFYHSYDYFRIAELSSYNYSNNGASLIFNRVVGSAIQAELAVTGSLYDFSTSDRMEPSAAWHHSYSLGQYGIHASLIHALNDKHKLDYGLEMNLYDLDRGTVFPLGDKSLLNRVNLGKEKGVEGSLFATDEFKILKWLSLNAGVRYTIFAPMGPSDVLLYDPGTPRDTRYIADTLHFMKNEPIKRFNEPDIRLSASILTDEDGSLKLAFNSMHQNLFMLNTTTTLAPNTQWKLADYHLSPSGSSQVSFGVFRTIPAHGLEGSVEVFYKRTQNYPEFRGGADFLKNDPVETSVLQGRQKAYGLELYVKRSRRKLEGWISYTYSRSIIKIDGEHSWEKINNGIAYASDYDIPNSLNVVLNYYFSRRVILSSIVTWKTGRPITYPESVYYVDGSPYLNYSERNAYRIPDYFRMDFSLTIEGNLKAKKLLHSSYIFNLYNATSRMNAYSVYFNTEGGRIRSYKYSVIGVPVFTATWLFKFGNYASE